MNTTAPRVLTAYCSRAESTVSGGKFGHTYTLPAEYAVKDQTGWIVARFDTREEAEQFVADAVCYVCGSGLHAPTDSHDYWSTADAARHFAAEPNGTLPSMTAVETLDPREAVFSARP